jgi:hypothetical protein
MKRRPSWWLPSSNQPPDLPRPTTGDLLLGLGVLARSIEQHTGAVVTTQQAISIGLDLEAEGFTITKAQP